MTNERCSSIASISSSLSPVDDDESTLSALRRQVNENDAWRRWEAIIPGVIFRHCQPGSDWTSARVRRVHRLLLIALPSLPLLFAALVSAIYLHHRYLAVANTVKTFSSFIQRCRIARNIFSSSPLNTNNSSNIGTMLCLLVLQTGRKINKQSKMDWYHEKFIVRVHFMGVE